MNVQSPLTAAGLDKESYLSARDSSDKDLLVYAARESGHSVLQIRRNFKRMAKSHSRLNFVEYIRHGLFRHDDFSHEQRAAYISNDRHWEFTHQCNSRSWAGIAEDKVLATMLLSKGGIPVPPILGVIDRSARIYPGLDRIDTPDKLRDLVHANQGGGLFGKIVDGMVSFGAFRIESGDATHLKCSGHAPMTYDNFMSDFIGDNAYVLQDVLFNHDEISPYASALATVRMINLVTTDGVYCPQAIIKIPQGGNIADAFWRSGNLASEVNVETGVICSIAERAEHEVKFHDDHPKRRGFMGMKLPYWAQLCDLNARAAQIFAPIRYQSTDIAITPSGPVLVELNYGGGFDLPQYASGRGMLTPEVRSFFEQQGCAIGSPKHSKRSLFGSN